MLKGKMYGSGEHVGIGYLAAALKEAGHPFRVHYIQAEDATEELVEQLSSGNPLLVGFMVYAMTVRRIVEVCDAIKEKLEDVHICLGGPTPSFEDVGLIEGTACVDTCVRGEGEFTLVELVEALCAGSSLEGIESLTYRDPASGRAVVNPLRPPILELDSLSWPTREIMELESPQYLIIETSRGCLAKCTFCTAANNDFYNGRSWRGRSVKSVVDEMQHLYEEHDVSAFNIIDASFEDPGKMGKRRNIEFADELLERGLPLTFMVHFRAETVQDEDMPRIDRLIEAGLVRVSLGLESGSDRTLNEIYHKIATVEDNERIVRLLRSRHIALVAGFIMFEPYDTFDDLRDNVGFLRRTRLACRFENYEQHLEIYPGTPIRESMLADGLLSPSFDFSFDECDWAFQDPRLTPLRDGLGSIGPDSGEDFERFDMETHLFSMLLRRHSPNEVQAEAISEFEELVDREREELGACLATFFEAMLDRAEAEQVTEAEIRAQIHPRILAPTAGTRARVSRAKVALLRKLRELGLDVRLQGSAALTRAGT